MVSEKGGPLALWGLQDVTSTCNYIKKIGAAWCAPQISGRCGGKLELVQERHVSSDVEAGHLTATAHPNVTRNEVG